MLIVIAPPLLETTIQGASSIIINVRGGQDLKLEEIYSGLELVRQVISPDANVLFGVGFDEELRDEVQVTLIATGFFGSTMEEKASFFNANNPTASNVAPITAQPATQQPAKEAPFVENKSATNANLTQTSTLRVEEDKNIPPFLRKLKK